MIERGLVNLDLLNYAMVLGGIVLLVAAVAVRISSRTGMPSLLIYLGIGILLGESGLGIQFSDYGLTTVLGYLALAIILGEGGLTTDWSSIRGAVAPAALLATLGTMVSVFVVAAVAHWVLGMAWLTAVMVGAVVSSTDAAAVFSVLRRVPLPRRLTGMLEAESGCNDAPVVILVVALADIAAGSEHSLAFVAVHAVIELIGGGVLGLGLGFAGAALLRSVALPSVGLYPIAALGIVSISYGLAAATNLSGFISIYLCALVLGNSELPHRKAVQGFAEGFGWLAQIGLFVLLGLLVSPARLPGELVPALVIGTALLVAARPLSVIASVTWFGYGWRDQAFLSWAGLRGAVPIVLATIPVDRRAGGPQGLFEMVFLLVVIFILVQAPTLPMVARLLRLPGDAPVDLDLDTSPLGAFDAHVIQVVVGPASRLHGLEIFELRLPPEAKVTLVVRGTTSFVPLPSTRLQRGDGLLVVTTEHARGPAEERLRAVSEGGRLATWRARSDGEDERQPWWRRGTRWGRFGER
ncbi:MAG: potassium/proton antiporter [Actinomycetales bacterium]